MALLPFFTNRSELPCKLFRRTEKSRNLLLGMPIILHTGKMLPVLT